MERYTWPTRRAGRRNFFRKGNLLALRELALRRTAEQVDVQMQDYRRVKGVKVSGRRQRILVCVGPSPFAVRLIRASQANVCGAQGGLDCSKCEAPGKVHPSERDIKGLAIT